MEHKDLFIDGNFVSHSGLELPWKIECDNLSNAEIQLFADIIFSNVQIFSKVEGVPQGGLRLAKALRKWTYTKGPILIVDDVLTTGNSMEKQRNERDAIGYVIFARAEVPSWINSLWTFNG